MDDACISRYLRAVEGDTIRAAERITATLAWRKEFKPLDGISPSGLEEECGMGRVYLNGFDRKQQPIMYMICRKNGSDDHMRGLRWSIYLLEKAISSMPPGVEKLSIVVDYSGMKLTLITSPGMNPLKSNTPMHITRMWIDTMQSHYPERMATSFMVNPGIYS